MKEELQKLKILLISILSATCFGLELMLLSWTTYQDNLLYIIPVVTLVLSSLILFYKWLNRLHRELLVIKYKRRKKKWD